MGNGDVFFKTIRKWIMSENPFEAQTTMQGGQIPPVGVKSAPSGVQFNLTVCLILSILGLLGACFGGLGLAMAEVQYQAMQNLDSPEAVEVPLVTSDDSGFSIDRIGKVGGEVSQQITKAIRSELDEKIEKKEPKLVQRMNKEIHKNRDDLRISIADSIHSKWFTTAQEFLSRTEQETLND